MGIYKMNFVKMMKTIKTIGIAIGIIAIVFVIYKAFFMSPPEIQAIKKKHQEEKKQYEETIKGHVAKEKELDKTISDQQVTIEDQDIIINESEAAFQESEKERLKYIGLYERKVAKYKPPDINTLTNLKDCKKEVEKAGKKITQCQGQVKRTEKSLGDCIKAKVEHEKQVENLNVMIEKKDEKIEQKDTTIAEKDRRIKQVEFDIGLLSKKKEPLCVFGFGPGITRDQTGKIYASIGFWGGINVLRIVNVIKNLF
jgi:uncharacterized protein (DUF3084 family)